MKRVKTFLSGIFLTLFLFPFPFSCDLHAQDPKHPATEPASEQIVIGSITIDGNRLTRSPIILREMLFHEKDTLMKNKFASLVKASRDNIFNTRLFNFVSIDTLSSAGNPVSADLKIHVVERWYIWPIPYIEISDRNLNAWLTTMDFSRLTYGIDLTISNVRGRNETLRFPIHFGFNRLFGFDYTAPYLNRKKTLGASFGVQLEQNRELIVGSLKNKPVYYKNPHWMIQQNIYSFLEVKYRPSLYSYHTARVIYNSYWFCDSLLNIPDYTYKDKPYLNFFTLIYMFKRDRRDIAYYPLKGSYFDISFVQNGLWSPTVNSLYFKTNLRLFWQLYKRWYYAAAVTGKYTPTGAPPYFLQQGLGYERDFVRGYEYYVVDGIDFALFKNNLKFALVQPRVLDLRFIKTQKFNPIPFAFYLNLFADMGYVYNSDENESRVNNLQNTLLLGGGLGLDFVTYYDLVARLEFSINKLGQAGIYIHFVAPV
jgi:outer membrane protein assembly factor BamA